jgi:hypothetical protein
VDVLVGEPYNLHPNLLGAGQISLVIEAFRQGTHRIEMALDEAHRLGGRLSS